ncbi:MAG: transcriptional regulator, ArgR family [Acidobacteria bacterium]|jgi:transcriptional regulator of arginine metabolism|nr:transcriptional regulator, ArgR family [Acidobacteriota bacterium]
MIKEKRQQAVINLIQETDISTQEELSDLLAKAGFSVTQSSVSRDLEQIGIVKKNGFYAMPQIADRTQRFGLINLVTAGENLIVANCESGLASAVAVRIDNAKVSELVGTIAGDDTIFLAVKDAKSQKSAIKKIWELFDN